MWAGQKFGGGEVDGENSVFPIQVSLELYSYFSVSLLLLGHKKVKPCSNVLIVSINPLYKHVAYMSERWRET
jgi:hypothetical protein